jgi:hypothetical protein
MSAKDFLWLGVLGAGVYFLYEWWTKPGGPGAAIDSAETSVANVIANTVMPPAAQVTAGSIIFSDGTTIPSSSLTSLNPTWQGNTLTFQYSAGTYALSPADSNGNYQATQLSGLGCYGSRGRRRIR